MRYELKSIGAWAFIKVSFFLNLIIGFVFGVLYSGFLGLIFAVGSAFPWEETGAPMPFDGEGFGAAFLFVLPFIFAIGGSIFYTLFGLIIVGIYNLITKLTGGFEMTLEPVQIAQQVTAAVPPAQPTPTYQPPPPPPERPAPPPPPPSGPPSSPSPPKTDPPQGTGQETT